MGVVEPGLVDGDPHAAQPGVALDRARPGRARAASAAAGARVGRSRCAGRPSTARGTSATAPRPGRDPPRGTAGAAPRPPAPPRRTGRRSSRRRGRRPPRRRNSCGSVTVPIISRSSCPPECALRVRQRAAGGRLPDGPVRQAVDDRCEPRLDDHGAAERGTTGAGTSESLRPGARWQLRSPTPGARSTTPTHCAVLHGAADSGVDLLRHGRRRSGDGRSETLLRERGDPGADRRRPGAVRARRRGQRRLPGAR